MVPKAPLCVFFRNLPPLFIGMSLALSSPLIDSPTRLPHISHFAYIAMALSPLAALVVVVLCLHHSSTVVAVSSSPTLLSLQTASAPWTARNSAFLVNWAGALWLAGGLTSSGIGLADLWPSGDAGVTWQSSSTASANTTAAPAALPGPCAAGDAKVVDSSQVVVWCGVTNASPLIYSNTVYTSSDVLLRYWRSSTAPYTPRYGFVTGVFTPLPGDRQTVVILAGKSAGLLTDVWTYALGGYQRLTASAPFTPRVVPAAAMGQDGTLMVIAGGQQQTGGLNVYLNDVWTLRLWGGGSLATWTLLTAKAPWPGRTQAVAFNVAEYLYMTAGNVGGNDLWVTPDYGSTWVQVSGAANYAARTNPSVVAVGRQLVLLGGSAPSLANFQDVWTGFF